MLTKLIITTLIWGLAFGQLTEQELLIFTSFGINITDYSDEFWLMEHTGIPDHDVGDFPNNDNPNRIEEQNHDFLIPKNPDWLETPGCLPMGAIAMSKSGVPFYNPYTGAGLNAIGNEVFDDCDGHPDPTSTYHYHKIPTCLYEGTNSELMGVAFDGYPIFGPKDENGDILTTADLDFCHGRMYNGRYQYHITYDFPYIMACYRGQPSVDNSRMNMPPPGMDGPPPADGNPPVDGERPPPPGGMMNWEACYAYCENPATNEDTGCEEPVYPLGPQDDSSGDSSGAMGVRFGLKLVLMSVVFLLVNSCSIASLK